jgi:hypothetical protein
LGPRDRHFAPIGTGARRSGSPGAAGARTSFLKEPIEQLREDGRAPAAGSRAPQ